MNELEARRITELEHKVAALIEAYDNLRADYNKMRTERDRLLSGQSVRQEPVAEVLYAGLLDAQQRRLQFIVVNEQLPDHMKLYAAPSTIPTGAAMIVTKAMVDRFLNWPLPENFNPDAGISFKPDYNEGTKYPRKHKPVGTNLLDADQARQMLEYALGDSMSKLAHSNQETMDEIERRKAGREGCCGHASDCAVHNMPAYSNGPCDCYVELLHRLDVWATGASTPFPHNEVMAEAASAIRAILAVKPAAQDCVSVPMKSGDDNKLAGWVVDFNWLKRVKTVLRTMPGWEDCLIDLEEIEAVALAMLAAHKEKS